MKDGLDIRKGLANLGIFMMFLRSLISVHIIFMLRITKDKNTYYAIGKDTFFYNMKSLSILNYKKIYLK